MAFPCEENENEQSTEHPKSNNKERSSDKYQTTATSFGARINHSSSKGSIVPRKR